MAIAEAEPGDVLEVQILKVDLDANFACNVFGVGSGFLPMEYPYGAYKVVPLDRKKMIGHFAPGIEIPLKPFFGSMGVAPAGGKIDSAPPFVHAGNLDNKELVAGTALYIPVAAKGALFQAGDDLATRRDQDLKEATTMALRDMIAFLVEEKHLGRDEAYMLASVAVDMNITQLVDGNVGVHAMCPKKIFTAKP